MSHRLIEPHTRRRRIFAARRGVGGGRSRRIITGTTGHDGEITAVAGSISLIAPGCDDVPASKQTISWVFSRASRWMLTNVGSSRCIRTAAPRHVLFIYPSVVLFVLSYRRLAVGRSCACVCVCNNHRYNWLYTPLRLYVNNNNNNNNNIDV